MRRFMRQQCETLTLLGSKVALAKKYVMSHGHCVGSLCVYNGIGFFIAMDTDRLGAGPNEVSQSLLYERWERLTPYLTTSFNNLLHFIGIRMHK
jgi:hypothetical protein